MRSRASSFPRATWRALASSLPPCIAASSLLAQVGDQPRHRRGVMGEFGRVGIEGGLEDGHQVSHMCGYGALKQTELQTETGRWGDSRAARSTSPRLRGEVASAASG